MKIIQSFLLLVLIGINTYLHAQSPALKVDLNIGSRVEQEVNEPGFLAWPINGGPDTLEFDGVKIAFTNGTIEAHWYKAGVQSPFYARLANDGIVTGDCEMQISGLPIGHHTLVTYHNTFDNPETNTFANISVLVNDVLQVDNVPITNRAESNEAATSLFFSFDVADAKPVVLRFKAVPTATSNNNKITICGFLLNASDPNLLAKSPSPGDLDEHARLINDQLTLSWTPPAGSLSQDIYFGTSKAQVQAADHATASFIGNQTDTFLLRRDLYSMDTYYWRVDPINSKGEIVKGDVWTFKVGKAAFDGAEGYGGTAQGGRGGKVVYVTNLNDSGLGSFRAAVTGESGPRTVIFNVSGIIRLDSRLIMDDNLTIAGQTAPGKGICFRAAPIGLGNETICRFIRMRLGAGTTYDGIGMAGANHSIVDHCSISWTIDEALSSRGAKNITLQRTMISEALNVAGHKNYPAGTAHGYAATIGGDTASFHHNLLAHCEGRNWSLGGGLDGNGYYAGELDIFNNVCYNWGGRATDGGAHEVNFVGNYYKKGPSTTQDYILKAQLEGVGKGSQSYFYHNNILEETNGSLSCDGSTDNCSRTTSVAKTQVVDWEVFVGKPFFASYATIDNANDAYKTVLSDVGCTMPMFDEHDQRIIQETLNGTTTYNGSKTRKRGLIDHQNDAGGYEDYPELIRPENFDTDLDGLPDWWEDLHGTNPNSGAGNFSDSNADPDMDGYTLLEDYLKWMSVPHIYLDENASVTIDAANMIAGYEKSPILSTEKSNAALDVKYEGSKITIETKAGNKGIFYHDFKVNDSEGSSMVRTIGVAIGATGYDDTTPYVEVIPEDSVAMVLNHKNDGGFNVYPTIFDDHINLKPNSNNQSIIVQLFDLGGNEIKHQQFNVEGRTAIKWDFNNHLPAKLYVLRISDAQSGKLLLTQKLIKR